MATRKIVEIDEAKCNGCGECVPSCAEGAIQIIDGKARLVSDVYCDGLGTCLGTCPQDAIRIVEREAPAFDEEAARRHVESTKAAAGPTAAPSGCPGTAAQQLRMAASPPAGRAPAEAVEGDGSGAPSGLGNWPVQLHLVPPGAPFLQGPELLLAADCVPLAYADFHRRFLRGRPVVIGCPKLDDAAAYVDKLADVLARSPIERLTVVHMEVPCCSGLLRVAEAAIAQSGREVRLDDVTISIRGEVLAEE